MVIVMLAGGYFRFVGLNWDDFTHLHPDERFLTGVAATLGGALNPSGSGEARSAQIATCAARYPDTGGVGTYFDALCSTLNPLNSLSSTGLYVYGTLPLFIARGAGDMMVDLSNWFAHNVLANTNPDFIRYDGSQWTSYDGIHLVWRFLSAVSEIGVILIAFLIGTKLHDKWIGLLAAVFYAAAVFSIQMAHFGTVDVIGNLFAALSLLFAVRVQRDGKLSDYLLFGVFFGCSVASRINLAPLAALIAVAAFIQILPTFENRVAPGERTRALLYHGGGLVLAAFLSLLVFRLANPYAFAGPGFFNLSLDTRWLANMGSAQGMNSGAPGYDSPPNFQWASRIPYIYPLNNMVIWGLGLPLGIIAWVAWAVAGYRMLRAKPGALQNILLVIWVLIYFGWLGRNWVTTMRYFLPLYMPLTVLAAWGLVTLIRRLREHRVRRILVQAVMLATVAFTVLWAAMFTNIYRNQLTRVQASEWVWENVPGDFAMRISDPQTASPLIQIALDNNGLSERRLYDDTRPGSEHQFIAPISGNINTVYALFLDDPEHDADGELIYFTITRVSDNTQLGDAILSADLTRADDTEFMQPRAIPFPTISVVEGEIYQLNVLLIDGGPFISGGFSIPVEATAPSATPLINIPLLNNNYGGSPDDLPSRVTRLDQYNPVSFARFTAPASGIVTSIHAPHLGDANDDQDAETLRFTITRADDMSRTPIATATLNANLARDAQNILGSAYDIPLDTPLMVQEGVQYEFRVEIPAGGSVLVGGSVFTWEGAWDDPIPTIHCQLPLGTTLADNPPPGLYWDSRLCSKIDPWSAFVNGYTQDIVYEDVPAKRDKILLTLDNSDYLAISSNRFYDTLSRNPLRWPMTNFYYEKLFAGELGYDLVATFQETFELGPLRVSDQYLPTYDGPKWLNELEAEEAFSVYDHPVVFIFQKRADYDRNAVHDLLYSIPLTRINEAVINYNCPGISSMYCDPTIANVATLTSDQAAKAPTQLMLTEPMREAQYEGGTWSDRFDDHSIVNQNQPVAVVVWWFTIILFGFAAFPLLFVLLPALPDRGYAFAKFAGMLIAGWATWYLASFRIPVWSQIGIAVALVLLFLFGMLLLWRRRADFVDFLRERWKLLVGIELITLVAFLVMLGVRLTNPDLWQPTYGGEKPMDFAYFNAVLRSSIFPPYDPWYAGGFINYYYFGYVIIGAPVLLLKLFPSIAYNLILPTLFALTGIAAFAVAYAIVHSLRERYKTMQHGGIVQRMRRLGNPWVAGIAALLLAVVLGNLDTPRVFLTGVASAGGYVQPAGMEYYLLERYSREHGTSPDAAGMQQLIATAANPSISDKVGYELDNSVKLVTSLATGFSRVLSGQGLNVSANRWFWAPTRVIQEIPGDASYAINEMPSFTYIYGDMHAHMISMPMQLAIMGLLLNEILLAGTRRRRGILALTLALLGLYVGMLRATNTWDWVTFMVLSGAGLVFAWWLAQLARYPGRSFWGRFTRRSVLEFAGYVGGFVVFSFVVVLPFTYWFASGYSSVSPWMGNKTPLWAYFDIHGLFLFLILSLLVWETARWLRTVYVRSLRGTWGLLLVGLFIALAMLAGALLLAVFSYQVTLIILPMLLWVALLFFRSNQSRPMQFVLLLIGLALGLTLGVEYIVLDGDIGRQNTVFKFYIQAWLLLSVAGGAAFAWLVASVNRWKPGLRGAWTFVLVLLIAAASLFPIMATRGKAAYRFDINTCAPVTLDGIDFMKCATQYEGSNQVRVINPELAAFTLDEDYAMIRWLQENITGTPTVMEGLSEDTQYKWNGRISIYTGLPSVIGWNWHQRQQRSLTPLTRFVESRNANVNAFYQTTSIGTAWEMLQHYRVDYVVVGKLEQAYYLPEGLAKFRQMVDLGLLEPVFEQGSSTIYRVNTEATLSDQG